MDGCRGLIEKRWGLTVIVFVNLAGDGSMV